MVLEFFLSECQIKDNHIVVTLSVGYHLNTVKAKCNECQLEKGVQRQAGNVCVSEKGQTGSFCLVN